jgi:hypothetical protein
MLKRRLQSMELVQMSRPEPKREVGVRKAKPKGPLDIRFLVKPSLSP